MWQYTTETIINSNSGNLLGDKRVALFKKNGEARAYDATGASYNKLDTFIIDGVNSFILNNIKHITRYAYRNPANAVAKVEIINVLTSTNPNGVYRLTVELNEEGRVSSYMQDAYLRHKKPFHYEIPVVNGETVGDIADAFVALIKKDLALTDFKYFTAEKSVESGTTYVKLTGGDNHIRFASAPEVVLVEDTEAGSAERLTGYQNYSIVKTGSITTVGDCGAGTVEHLIKDLRIPTNATINPFAADNGGRPIPGGQYDQLLVEYETPRRHVAGGVMGSVGEVSRTSHVFFIEKNKASEIIDWFASFAKSANLAILDEIANTTEQDQSDNVDRTVGPTPESVRNHPGSVQ